MKLFRCNGQVLEVRDVGPVIYRVTSAEIPIMPHGWWIEEDTAARDRLLELKSLGHSTQVE